MPGSYRIAIADDNVDAVFCLRQLLAVAGHQVVVEATSGQELIEKCRAAKPDVIITDIVMPGVDGIEAAIQITDENDIPIIVVSGFLSEELLERSQDCHVFGYLIKPIRQDDLTSSIEVAFRRHQEFRVLREDACNSKQALDDRKIVERAKGILMTKWQLDEPSAFRHLQKLARAHRQKLADVARSMLLGKEVLDSFQDPA
jgi:two-component system, response regulator PdtaR